MLPDFIIIGVGNPLCGDDGVGIAVACSLRRRVSGDISIVEECGESVSLMERWKAARRVMLIDAVCSGAPAGTIHRFDVNTDILPGVFRCSTHSCGVREAIELARTLHSLPERVTVFGIEGENFNTGGKLTAAVERAAAAVCDQILDEVAGEYRMRTEELSGRGSSITDELT